MPLLLPTEPREIQIQPLPLLTIGVNREGFQWYRSKVRSERSDRPLFCRHAAVMVSC